MTIELYEFGPTRSLRARWALLELDVPFESIEGRELIRSERLRAIHPQGKLPAIKDDGRPLFESAAICTWLADSHPDKGLISASGTWERALHDQWVAFCLSELEAALWNTARNTFVYPENERITACFEQDAAEAKKALAVYDAHLADNDYMVGNKFSVTDIITGFAINWARRAGHMNEFGNVLAYNERLLARPLCPLTKGD